MSARNRTKDRPNSKGRNVNRVGSDGAVIILRRSFWTAPHISALSVTARALIVELTAMYKGPERSAQIYLSVRDAARRLGLSCLKAASGAIQELVAVGLLSETMGASFAVKGGEASRARAFRLNWKTLEGSPVGLADLVQLDFQALGLRQKRRISARGKVLDTFEKRKTTVEDSSTLAACRAEFARRSVEENATLTEGSAKTGCVEETSTHIYYQRGRGEPWYPTSVAGPPFQRISLSEKIGPTLSALRAGMFVHSTGEQAALFCRLVAIRRMAA